MDHINPSSMQARINTLKRTCSSARTPSVHLPDATAYPGCSNPGIPGAGSNDGGRTALLAAEPAPNAISRRIDDEKQCLMELLLAIRSSFGQGTIPARLARSVQLASLSPFVLGAQKASAHAAGDWRQSPRSLWSVQYAPLDHCDPGYLQRCDCPSPDWLASHLRIHITFRSLLGLETAPIARTQRGSMRQAERRSRRVLLPDGDKRSSLWSMTAFQCLLDD